MIAETPMPPYYSVIFTSIKNKNDEGYKEMSEKMVSLAKTQNGFLGVESAREKVGITVSYWKNLASIRLWKAQIDHLYAQEKGKNQWYKAYRVRIAKVEREYGFNKS